LGLGTACRADWWQRQVGKLATSSDEQTATDAPRHVRLELRDLEPVADP